MQSHHTMHILGPRAEIETLACDARAQPGDERLVPHDIKGPLNLSGHLALALRADLPAVLATTRALLQRPAPFPVSLQEVAACHAGRMPPLAQPPKDASGSPAYPLHFSMLRIFLAIISRAEKTDISSYTHALWHPEDAIWGPAFEQLQDKLHHTIDGRITPLPDGRAWLRIHMQQTGHQLNTSSYLPYFFHTLPNLSLINHVHHDDFTEGLWSASLHGGPDNAIDFYTSDHIHAHDSQTFLPTYTRRMALKKAGFDQPALTGFFQETEFQSRHKHAALLAMDATYRKANALAPYVARF